MTGSRRRETVPVNAMVTGCSTVSPKKIARIYPNDEASPEFIENLGRRLAECESNGLDGSVTFAHRALLEHFQPSDTEFTALIGYVTYNGVLQYERSGAQVPGLNWIFALPLLGTQDAAYIESELKKLHQEHHEQVRVYLEEHQ